MIVVVDDMITIGDFSSRCGLSPKVLQTYAEDGGLVPAAVDPSSGYRYYELAQLEQAATVRRLRRAGVGLANMSQFLAEPSADAVDSWERSLTAETLSRREALAEVRCRLGVGPERRGVPRRSRSAPCATWPARPRSTWPVRSCPSRSAAATTASTTSSSVSRPTSH